MNWFEALILGIIQGLTEFLPVSSSGHLELAKALFGEGSVPEESLLFTVLVHGATALATLLVFRKDVNEILKGLMTFQWNDETKFVTFILVSMVPAAAVGLLLEDQIEALFGGQITLVGAMLIVTGGLLFLADRAKNTDKPVGAMNAFIIGVSQAIAILPGISRSGATISAAVLQGIDREKAARFSFLMVVPLILGKMLLDLKDLATGEMTISQGASPPMTIGFLAAFFSGVLACRWMIALVKRAQLRYFSFYCFAVGAIAIAVSLL